MTENEAISILKHMKNLITVRIFEEEALDMAIQAIEENQKFHAIGTIEEFKALKEKNTEKKAIGSKLYNEACCPNCGYTIADDEFWALDEYIHYCEECGQAVKGIDWQ